MLQECDKIDQRTARIIVENLENHSFKLTVFKKQKSIIKIYNGYKEIFNNLSIKHSNRHMHSRTVE